MILMRKFHPNNQQLFHKSRDTAFPTILHMRPVKTDQPAHPRSLIRVSVEHSVGKQASKRSSKGQQSLRSAWCRGWSAVHWALMQSCRICCASLNIAYEPAHDKTYIRLARPLRKHACSNILKISPPKTESFQIKKKLIFFMFLLKT